MTTPATSPDTDWSAWHDRYADPESETSRRLVLIQDLITHWLDETAPRPVRILSVCAGDGRDIIQVLAERPADAARSEVTLVEKDTENCARAREAARAAGLDRLEVREMDASQTDAYVGAVPADLIVIAGVFGNIRNQDTRTVIDTLPQFCTRNALVIWTRRRRPQGIIATVANWFADAGFARSSYQPHERTRAFVGAHRYLGAPQTLEPGQTLFRFVR